MKLLFDQNLSPRLVQRLADCFPGSSHVQAFGMDRVADNEVLAYAEANGFALVSKDSDFFDPAMIRGSAAKIVWIRRGNCSTTEIETILRRHRDDIENLGRAERLLLLMLY